MGQDMLERLEELVRIESPSRDVGASRRVTALLDRWFTAIGLNPRRIESASGVHLVLDDPGDAIGDPILLIGHSDTVWPAGTLAGELPWRRDGGVLRGPGVLDMKSGLVIIREVLERLQGRPHRPVRVVITCDEESGSPTGTEVCTEAARGVAAAIGFESPHPDGALKVGRRGSTRLRLAVRGRAAHAALDPEAGVSAIDELVDQLLWVREVVAQASRTTPVLCNAGTITGGTRANVVPDLAEAEIGLRFIDQDSENDVLARLSSPTPRNPRAVVTTTIITRRPAWAAKDADRELMARIAAAGAALGQHIEGRPAAGAGDANLLGGPLGVPTVDGFGPMGGGAHAVSEHVLIPSIAERADLLEQILAR
jgi:glutamate carboxypeptidase